LGAKIGVIFNTCSKESNADELTLLGNAGIQLVISRKLLLLKIIVDPNPNGSNDFQQFTPF